MKELKVIVKTGKNGNLYTALVAELGYRTAYLSFDRNLCAELVGVSVPELMSGEGTYQITIGG